MNALDYRSQDYRVVSIEFTVDHASEAPLIDALKKLLVDNPAVRILELSSRLVSVPEQSGSTPQ